MIVVYCKVHHGELRSVPSVAIPGGEEFTVGTAISPCDSMCPQHANYKSPVLNLRPRDDITDEQIHQALGNLCEARPSLAEFTRLVTEGAVGDESYTMKLDGDDLAGFCYSIFILYSYFGYDLTKPYWEQS